MKSIVAAFLVAGVALPIAPPAAQTTADPAAAPATSASAPTPICTDRPTKANVVCAVLQGGVQPDAIDWKRFSSGGVEADTILHSNPTDRKWATSPTAIATPTPTSPAHAHYAGPCRHSTRF